MASTELAAHAGELLTLHQAKSVTGRLRLAVVEMAMLELHSILLALPVSLHLDAERLSSTTVCGDQALHLRPWLLSVNHSHTAMC